MNTDGTTRRTAYHLSDNGPGVEEAESRPDNWQHRDPAMECATCMWFVEKKRTTGSDGEDDTLFGRCRKRAPTLNGYPAVFGTDFCGDHKLDENRI